MKRQKQISIPEMIETYPISEVTANAARNVLAAVVFDMLDDDCGSPITIDDFRATIAALGHDVAITGALEYHRRAIEFEPFQLAPVGDLRWRI